IEKNSEPIILESDVIFFFQVYLYNIIFFFFFQAEDGIRDRTVTGVQTCALPISLDHRQRDLRRIVFARAAEVDDQAANIELPDLDRKSTRLNSSHRTISYAVFCLKKKKKKKKPNNTIQKKKLNKSTVDKQVLQTT